MKQVFVGILLFMFDCLAIFSSAKEHEKNTNEMTRSRQVSFSADTKVHDGKFLFVYPGRVAVDLSDTDSDEDLSLFAFSMHVTSNSDSLIEQIEHVEPKISLSPDLLARWNEERRKNSSPKNAQNKSALVHQKEDKA